MIIATICCRAGSTRVPNKALQEVGGITLLQRAIRQAKRLFSRVIVSTDGKEIARLARYENAEVISRPKELATSSASKWLVFRHLVEHVDCERVVDLDVGCPFREDSDVLATVEMLADYSIAQTAYISDRNPYFNMVHEDGGVVIPSMVTNSQDAPVVFSLSPAVFAFKVGALRYYNHWSECAMGLHIIPRERAWDIDTMFDLEVARLLWTSSKQ